MLLLRLYSAKAIIDFQVFQPITFLRACSCFCFPGAIIGEDEEIMLSREADWFDRVNQVCMN